MPARQRKHAGGRPAKFDEPARPVTVTLPERTLARLAAIDSDRANAIVAAVDATLPAAGRNHLVEIVPVTPGSGIILVPPSKALREIPWLKLAEVAPRRYLLTVLPGTPIESIEVAVRDLLETLPQDDDYDRVILDELLRILGTNRRENLISKSEMLFVHKPLKRDSTSGESNRMGGPEASHRRPNRSR